MAIAQDEKQRLLTVAEVADQLRCSRFTIYRALADGRLRGVRLGVGASAPIRVRPDDLERYLQPTATDEGAP